MPDHLAQSQCQNDSHAVSYEIASAWAKTWACACVHLVSKQTVMSAHLWSLIYQNLICKSYAWQYFFKVRKFKLSADIKKFSEVPLANSTFAWVITAVLETEAKTKHLANKAKQWLHEIGGSGSDLHCTVHMYKISSRSCHNFMRLTKWLTLVMKFIPRRNIKYTCTYICRYNTCILLAKLNQKLQMASHYDF